MNLGAGTFWIVGEIEKSLSFTYQNASPATAPLPCSLRRPHTGDGRVST